MAPWRPARTLPEDVSLTDDSTTPPESPVPAEPTPAEPAPTTEVAAEPVTAEAVEIGSPGAEGSAAGSAPVETTPATPATPAAPAGHRGLPLWAVLTAVGLAVGLLGFVAGWAIGRGSDDDGRSMVGISGPGMRGDSRVPFGGRNGELPFVGPGGEMPHGPDGQMPQMPFGRGDGGRGSAGARGAALGIVVEDGDDGVVIVRVLPGSPADEAGLETGDVVTEIDGTEVDDPAALGEAVGDHDPGDEVTLTVERDGETETVTAELADPSDLGSGMGQVPREPARAS